MTATQTGSVSIDNGAVTTAIRLGGGGTAVNIAAGAGALTLGNSVGTFTLTMGGAGGTTQAFINNSTNVATLNSDVVLNTGGGGSHAFAFGGTGNWALNNNFTNASGSVIVQASGVTGSTSAGTATLTGTNTIAGLQAANGGLLRITGGTTNVVTGGGNTGLYTSGNMEVAGGTLHISGGGSFFPIGGTAGQTSTFTVNGGAVVVANNYGTEVGQVGSGVLTINSGSFKSTDSANVGFHIADSAGQSGTVNLNGGSLIVNKVVPGPGTGAFYFNGGTLAPTVNSTTWFPNSANTSTEVRNGGGTVDTGAFNITVADDIVHSTFAGTNATDGGLTKAGTGTLTLSGANTYNGNTNINAGTLLLAGTNVSSVVVNSGGTLGGTGSTAGSVTFNTGSLVLASDAGTGLTAGGAVNFAGQTFVSFATVPTTGTTYDVINYGTLANLANLASTSRGTFGNTGTKVTFTAGSVATDTWNTTSGSWNIGTTSNWSNGVDSKFFNGDTVHFNEPAADSVVTVDSSKGVLQPVSVTIGNTSNTYTFTGSGMIGGTGTLTKNGAGTVIIATNNRFTGVTTINAGKLQIGDGTTDGSISGTASVTNNGVLEYNRVGNGFTYGGVISGTGSVVKSGTGQQTLSAANTYSGGTTVNGGVLFLGNANAFGTGVLTLNGGIVNSATGPIVNVVPNAVNVTAASAINCLANGSVTIAGNVTGSGPLAVSGIFNNNEFRFSGDNSGYTGTITTSGSNVRLNSGAASSAAAAWVVNGPLQLDGTANATNTYNFGSLAGTGNINGHLQVAGSTNNQILVVGALNTSTTFSGVIQNNSANSTATGNETGVGNILSLTKVGTGTLTLSGANTYTGVTTVSGGILRATSPTYTTLLANAGGVDLGTTGGKLQLDYTATTSPVGTVQSILTAGYQSFATGQIRSTTLSAGQTIGFGDNGTNTVTVRVTLPGDATLDGTVDFNDFLVLQNNFNTAGSRFDQGNFNYDGQTDFNDFLVLQNNFGQSIGFGSTAPQFTAEQFAQVMAITSVNQVPEPATLAGVGLAMAGLMRRRRVR